jgi:hypothetical protein
MGGFTGKAPARGCGMKKTVAPERCDAVEIGCDGRLKGRSIIENPAGPISKAVQKNKYDLHDELMALRTHELMNS